MASVIQISGLTKHYGPRRGVETLDLRVPKGSIFGFLGPNGAGKTTTIRVLMGFLRPSAGTARIFDLDCWRASALIKAHVGYVPGDLRLYPWLTGKSALRLVGRVRGVDLAGAGAGLAERFRLDMTVRVSRMSRGTRQKLGLLLALAPRPRLLVLDEPTSGLDPLMQDALHEEVRAMAKAGRTVFFSSHSLDEVQRLCDRVGIVREGRLVADEDLTSLRHRAGHEVRIVWRDKAAAGADPPACLQVYHRDGAVWAAVLQGPVEPFIAWLHGRPIKDLSVSAPDLDSLFRRYYGPQGPPS